MFYFRFHALKLNLKIDFMERNLISADFRRVGVTHISTSRGRTYSRNLSPKYLLVRVLSSERVAILSDNAELRAIRISLLQNLQRWVASLETSFYRSQRLALRDSLAFCLIFFIMHGVSVTAAFWFYKIRKNWHRYSGKLCFLNLFYVSLITSCDRFKQYSARFN